MVPLRVCLLWLEDLGVGCPASNNGGCVTSVGVILAPPGDVNGVFMEDAFFSPVTVTTPSAEMVNTRKSPGRMPSTSSKGWSNVTSPMFPILVWTSPSVYFRCCSIIQRY